MGNNAYCNGSDGTCYLPILSHLYGTFPQILRVVLEGIQFLGALSICTILPMMTYYDFISTVNIHIILPIHISIIWFFMPDQFSGRFLTLLKESRSPYYRDGISVVSSRYLIFLLQPISDLSFHLSQPISDIPYFQKGWYISSSDISAFRYAIPTIPARSVVGIQWSLCVPVVGQCTVLNWIWIRQQQCRCWSIGA